MSTTKGREMTSVKKKEKYKKKKELAKSKNWKGGLSQKWAPRWIENSKRPIQAKIMGIQKEYIPGGLKTRKAVQAKIRD